MEVDRVPVGIRIEANKINGETKLDSDQKKLMQTVLDSISDGKYYIFICPKDNDVSHAQRGYYYSVVLPFWKQLLIKENPDFHLMTIPKLHKKAMKMFLPIKEYFVNVNKGIIELGEESTSEDNCSEKDYALLIEFVIRFIAMAYGEVVPMPKKKTDET